MQYNIMIKVDDQIVGTVPVLNILKSYDIKINDVECVTRVRFNKQRIAQAFNKAVV